MNFKGLLSIVFIASEAAKTAGAFSSPHPHTISPYQTARFGTVRPDASDAIADALRLSEEYGPTSKQARVAWDIVEEMDSNDSSPAYYWKYNDIDAPRDYYDHIRSLSYLIAETNSNLSRMKELVTQIKDMELKDPSLARIPDDDGSNRALKVALAEAKAATEVHGASSAEAREAWDKLDGCFAANEDGVMELAEECDTEAPPMASTYRYSAAALKAHHLYDAAIDTALLDESLEALGMIDGLGKFVSLEKRRLDSLEGSVGP
mmetsp:Transcript_40762/g.85628  ORF Transcript_40762/g.85628 Transcript_40762/m.85628 type:complete len:263 (+) Transcript_40762:115-903(+)